MVLPTSDGASDFRRGIHSHAPATVTGSKENCEKARVECRGLYSNSTPLILSTALYSTATVFAVLLESYHEIVTSKSMFGVILLLLSNYLGHKFEADGSQRILFEIHVPTSI